MTCTCIESRFYQQEAFTYPVLFWNTSTLHLSSAKTVSPGNSTPNSLPLTDWNMQNATRLLRHLYLLGRCVSTICSLVFSSQ
ncbi:hypothetical protein D0Z07_1821 [Hyphodiscus hymeniophilus]|uniref:Uncharacterized protein n=1 Tax=Hyphodiscus hymeniophilus TaxID=353542 RepID=A0A9P6VNM1_9HELO|nr:hypothetical protein D0Z07_1821 [Hyphodiscus hymeniophilus]